MSLQVIGVGLHRTGSLSVKVALERLGYGPCYHGFEYAGRPGDIPLWERALDGEAATDWERIFGEYRAALDWPMILAWAEVIAAYPDAKVLLTVRDPDAWFDSHVALLEGFAAVEAENEMPDHHGAMKRVVFEGLDAMFSGRLFDRDHCIRVFERHNERIRAAVPARRLLVYQVSDGWGPLCAFLGVDAPAEPFPNVNSRAAITDNAYRAVARTVPRTDEMAWR